MINKSRWALAIGLIFAIFFFAAIVTKIPKNRSITKSSQINETQATLLQLQTMLEMHHIEHGHYPENLTTLQSREQDYSLFSDAWNNKIMYKRENSDRAQLTSLGPDGVKSNDDIIITLSLNDQ